VTYTSGPARWEPRPGPKVTLMAAEVGTVRTDGNGTQWHLTADGWQPYAVPSPGHCRDARATLPEPEMEAGL
jgi:hypothetical protein